MNSVNHATNPTALVLPPGGVAFWSANAMFWGAYAAALMIPWLGKYPVLDMLPNKAIIAGTGVGVSGMLFVFYGWLDRRSTHPVLLGVSALLACVVGAATFDAIVIAATQGPEAISLRWSAGGSFGSLLGGVPMPGRIGQYATLLIAWSLAVRLFTMRTRAEQPASSISPLPPDGALSVSGTTVRARDGNRTVLLDGDEIDWVAADGDYVRIHCGPKNLLVRATMKHSSGVLAPLGFVRVHRSAIVNPRRVREIVRDGTGDSVIVLRNGARVRTGRNYAAHVTALFP